MQTLTCVKALYFVRSSLVGTENLATPAEQHCVDWTRFQHGCKALVPVPALLQVGHVQDGSFRMARRCLHSDWLKQHCDSIVYAILANDELTNELSNTMT